MNAAFYRRPEGFDALVHELRQAASHLAADAALLRARGRDSGIMKVECCEVIADLLARGALTLAGATPQANGGRA